MPWYNVKVVGGKGVGKSSLVRRFLLGEFGEDYPGGRQIFWEKASLPCVDNDKDYNHGLIVWDGDPVNLSHSLGIELRDDVIGEAVVVVYDVTNPRSFHEAMTHLQSYTWVGMSWRPRFVDPRVGGPRVMVLVGSKADLLMDRDIEYYEIAQEFAERHGIPFMEVSAFTGMNVHNLFSKIGMMVQSHVFFWNWSVNRRPALRSMCKLDLSHSQLYKLPEAIGFLPSLTHLFLNDNHLSFLHPEIIRRLVNLQELDLRNNLLNGFALDFTELSSLQRLSLQGNPLKNDDTRKLIKLAHERWIDIASECTILS